MFRQSATRRATLLLRSSSNSSKPSTTNSITNRLAAQRRFASTEAGGNAFVPNPPSQKQRSWRNRFVRLGLAGGVIYFYNTSTVFAEEPTLSLRPQPLDSKDAPTLNTIGEKVGLKSEPPTPTSADAQVQQQEEGGLEGLESQAHNEGAFNPETGEINWDCPCLGGMAYGPCGEEFREAFSCFVYSKEEPKGMDCIEKFKGMQDCFRLHPEVYGSELQEDEVDEQLTEQIAQRDREEHAIKAQQQQGQQSTQGDINLAADPAASNLNDAEKRAETTEIRKVNETTQAASQKEEELVPRAWHENDDGEPKTQK